MVAMWMIEQERSERSLAVPYAWVIDRDRNYEINEGHKAAGEEPLNEDASEVGTVGPRTAPEELVARLNAGEGVRFRLLDEGDLDDCNDNRHGAVAEDHLDYRVVFEGRLLDPEGEWPMGPLDDFGAYRAIEIELFEDGRWVQV